MAAKQPRNRETVWETFLSAENSQIQLASYLTKEQSNLFSWLLRKSFEGQEFCSWSLLDRMPWKAISRLWAQEDAKDGGSATFVAKLVNRPYMPKAASLQKCIWRKLFGWLTLNNFAFCICAIFSVCHFSCICEIVFLCQSQSLQKCILKLFGWLALNTPIHFSSLCNCPIHCPIHFSSMCSCLSIFVIVLVLVKLSFYAVKL